MSNNRNLLNASKNKNDEFYTQYEDIEKELSNYPVKYFKDKVIYCPCDVGVEWLDVPRSNFIKYFEDNKERLGYKKLLHTSLQEGYDFRSEECKQYFEEADIVVTNPPFSLFRDFVGNLENHNLKYCIVGNMNAITYKEIFPLIKENRLWLGNRSLSKDMYYIVPKHQQQFYLEQKKEGSAYKIIDGQVMGRLASACWFTNMDVSKRHEDLILTKNYKNESYSKYDNYDVIEINKVTEIPYDYDGVMGVPITFLDKYNPDQFEILGCSYEYGKIKEHKEGTPYNCIIDGKEVYKRIFIRRKR